ncbi:hypothetical protein [Actinomadura gamaensis]|uniref:DivIVA domain-containing protein n=1 Tax=Actinomadura gamaensis TaxID=1763541 RepID=A0ABV9TNW0_9ACTN
MSTDRSKTVVMVVLVLAGVAVLAAVVVLAMGRGGELARTHPDVPPLPLIDGVPVTGPEVAMLRLPRALWGYQMGVTDEALHRLAYALTERDARMAALEQHVADLRRQLDETERPEAGPSHDPFESGPERFETERRDAFEGEGPDAFDHEGRDAFGAEGRDAFAGEGPEVFEGEGPGVFEGGRELLENEEPRKR